MYHPIAISLIRGHRWLKSVDPIGQGRYQWRKNKGPTIARLVSIDEARKTDACSLFLVRTNMARRKEIIAAVKQTMSEALNSALSCVGLCVSSEYMVSSNPPG